MEVFFLISAVLFITTFGIYSIMHNAGINAVGVSTMGGGGTLIGIISGFILPVIPLTQLFGINFFFVFLINLPIAWFLGPIITRIVLAIFGHGLNLPKAMMFSFVLGIISLIIGFFS